MTPAQRVAKRYLRAQAGNLVTEVNQHLQAVGSLHSDLALHATTMEALILAGEARRLGRTSNIKIKSMAYDGQRVTADVQGTTADYDTRITLKPSRGHHCTCPDWARNGKRVGPCKHVLALGREWLAGVVASLSSLDGRLEDILSRISL